MNFSSTGLVATEDTARALTAMLQVNKTLTHLDLSENWNFSDSGADWAYIFKRLSARYHTRLFELSRRLLATEDTAHALTTILQFNKRLRHLDLSESR